MACPAAAADAGQLGASTAFASSVHPFVFFTRADYQSLLARRDPASAAALRLLEQRVSGELKTSDGYLEPYSGCDLNVYLQRFSLENASATRVASDLALYSYLSGLGAGYGSSSQAHEAAQKAKAILLAWARGGFRENGQVRADVGQFCENGAQTTVSRLDVSLQIGRGVAAWVQAQDLLEGQGVLSQAEKQELDAFVSRLHALVLNAARYWAANAYSDCERYSNHVSIQLLALLSSARLEGDRAGFMAAAVGTGGTVPTPFVKQIAENIYGTADAAKRCSPQSTADAFERQHPPAPGEIVDRYRSGEAQTLGYPIYSLTALLLSADVLQEAGMKPMQFSGPRGQSLSLALRYYGYIFDHYLELDETRVAPGDHEVADEAVYAGHAVSGPAGVTVEGRDDLLEPFVLGYCLDHDPSSAAVLRKAMSFSGRATPLYGIYSRSLPCLAALPAPR